MRGLPPGPRAFGPVDFFRAGIVGPAAGLRQLAARHGDPFRIPYRGGAITYAGTPEANPHHLQRRAGRVRRLRRHRHRAGVRDDLGRRGLGRAPPARSQAARPGVQGERGAGLRAHHRRGDPGDGGRVDRGARVLDAGGDAGDHARRHRQGRLRRPGGGAHRADPPGRHLAGLFDQRPAHRLSLPPPRARRGRAARQEPAGGDRPERDPLGGDRGAPRGGRGPRRHPQPDDARPLRRRLGARRGRAARSAPGAALRRTRDDDRRPDVDRLPPPPRSPRARARARRDRRARPRPAIRTPSRGSPSSRRPATRRSGSTLPWSTRRG